ncbi:MAG: hypothetical protein EXR94_09225 [Gemmatimonadetes bacterium]|nr:hypothetical protein [Gemmatimonadota bacterium]
MSRVAGRRNQHRPGRPMTSTALFPRESTTEAHRHAETRPLNRALARGGITLEQWRCSLEQHLLVYRALDHRLDQIQQTHPAWAAAFADEVWSVTGPPPAK